MQPLPISQPSMSGTQFAIASPTKNTQAAENNEEKKVLIGNKSSKSQSTSKLPELIQTPAVTNWKERGEYHLGRKELDLAIDAFTKALQESEVQRNSELTGESLKDLGRAFLEKEQWAFSAKIFNGAYALLQKSPNEKSRQATLALMAEVERRFLDNVWNERKQIDPKVYLERRQKLQSLRQASQTGIKSEAPAQVLLLDFTQGISRFLEEILKSGFDLFGKPPCDYSLIGLGSLARKEMSPYSDLEFALLINKSLPENLEYFRKMVQWLELQVIHLGETAIKILDRGNESPVVRGFSFDDGGNTPLGKQGYVELIETPEKLAKFQSERFYEEDLILSNVLRGADVIVGSESLYKEYVKAVQDMLCAKSAKPPLSIAQARALNLLQGHLVEFEPRIDKKKEETPIYNIKAELYRLPSFLIAGLADYFGIGEQNTWKRLEALVQAKILSSEGAKHLQDAMAATMRLRIRCHLYYGKECEDVYHPSMELKILDKKLQNVFVLTDTDIDEIVEIYRVIFPLHRLFKQVCQTRDFAKLSKESFYDTSSLTQGEAYEELHQYARAKKCYQQAAAMNPDDAESLTSLADLHLKLAEHIQAKEYADKAYALGKRKNDKNILAGALRLEGLISNNMGNSKKALEYHEEALRHNKKIYGTEHPDVATDLGNLGLAWQALGDAKKAIGYFEEALRVDKKVYGDEHPHVAICLNNLGFGWQVLGEAKKAIGYFEEALRIDKKVYGNEHPQVATILNNLGSAWKELGDAKKAIGCYEEALRIDKKIYGDEHPDIAIRLSNLGLAWEDLGDAKKAISYCEEALHIGKKVYGDEHPMVATYLNNLGYAWNALDDAKKAFGYYEEALRIRKKVYGDEHPDVASSLNNLGLISNDLGDAKKAIAYLEEALRIDKKVYGGEHPDVALYLNNLGLAWQDLGDAKKAIGYYEEALRIGKKVYGNEHPSVATRLSNIGSAWKALGDFKKAIEFYEEALRINKKVYGNKHPTVGVNFYSLGVAWKALGDAKKAIGYFEEVLRIDKKIYGNEHPNVSARLNSLGTDCQYLGDAKKAIAYFEEALRIDKKVYGSEHPDVAIDLSNLGSVWRDLGDPKKALGYYEEALHIDKKVYGTEHPDVAIDLSYIGNIWRSLGEPNKSITFQEQALAIFKKAHPLDQSRIAFCNLRLGEAMRDLKDGNKALDYFKQSFEMLKKVHPAEHPEIAFAKNELGLAYSDVSDTQNGLTLLKEAGQIYQKLYPNGHPDLAKNCYYLGLVWKKLEDTAKARENMSKALTIYQKFYDSEHPQVQKVKAGLNNLKGV